MNGVLDKRKHSPLHQGEEQLSDPEEHILKKKLQIKSQALVILGQELDQCRVQRDRYKLVAEQLQEDLDRRKQASEKKIINGFISPGFSIHKDIQGKNKGTSLEEETKLVDLLQEAKEENKCLRLQVSTLRQKLKEAEDDIKALRSKKSNDFRLTSEVTPALHQREEMIEQLEKLNIKCMQLKVDLKSALDEKQELEMERDAFKCKAHRLNYELAQALHASKPVDIDALVNENRYLQERLQQLLEEKDLAQQSVQKYKSMLDSKRQKGTIKLGGKSSMGSVMTFKQVEQLLKQGPNIPAQKSVDALSELHSVCTALLEAVNDKNLALAHQKKANKILASRICELDRTVQSPTNRLLEGYSSAEVDVKCDSTSVTSDLSEEQSESKTFEETTADQDTKSKQSDETSNTSAEPCIKSKDCIECCSMKSNIEEKIQRLLDEEIETEQEKSFFRPIHYLERNENEVQILNFNERLKLLPEHLRELVQKNLDELRANDR
ncbi:coiled-coil domain-containing protein 149 [Phymastichus coffea]|uniref:coiled-coil domain-containing protein 149 n=1 Tax=Phymastichus coffea TaxID=108790 RepID=UPI00273BB85D|nr:coiled-coil domain-containing protein 149 [Phymastichus coffea]